MRMILIFRSLFSDTLLRKQNLLPPWHTHKQQAFPGIFTAATTTVDSNNSNSNSNSNRNQQQQQQQQEIQHALYRVWSSSISAVQYQQPRQTTFVIRHTSYIRVSTFYCVRTERLPKQTRESNRARQAATHKREKLHRTYELNESSRISVVGSWNTTNRGTKATPLLLLPAEAEQTKQAVGCLLAAGDNQVNLSMAQEKSRRR